MIKPSKFGPARAGLMFARLKRVIGWLQPAQALLAGMGLPELAQWFPETQPGYCGYPARVLAEPRLGIPGTRRRYRVNPGRVSGQVKELE